MSFFFLFFLLRLTTVQLLFSSTMLIATLSFSSNPSPSFKTGSGSKVIWGMISLGRSRASEPVRERVREATLSGGIDERDEEDDKR